MKYLIVILALLILQACGDDSKFTWGDLSQQIGENYCGALYQCGSIEHQSDYNICVEHVVFHLCDVGHTCGVVVDEVAATAAMDMCSVALHALEPNSESCFELDYGYLPPECDDLWTFQPDPIPATD